jgi:hypothetical protein
MTSKKPKTRWGCIIISLIVIILLGGGAYLFFFQIYPMIANKVLNQGTYSPPQINKEGQDRVKNTQDYGEPIKDNEQAGRTDPFAPI